MIILRAINRDDEVESESKTLETTGLSDAIQFMCRFWLGLEKNVGVAAPPNRLENREINSLSLFRCSFNKKGVSVIGVMSAIFMSFHYKVIRVGCH